MFADEQRAYASRAQDQKQKSSSTEELRTVLLVRIVAIFAIMHRIASSRWIQATVDGGVAMGRGCAVRALSGALTHDLTLIRTLASSFVLMEFPRGIVLHLISTDLKTVCNVCTINVKVDHKIRLE